MSDRSRLRLVVLSVLVVSLVATLLGRLWYVQVLAAPTYRAAASGELVRDIVTEAPRGVIVDDAGRRLVDNRTALVVSVDRISLAEQSDGGAVVLTRLAKVLHSPVASLQDKIRLCGAPVMLPDGHEKLVNGKTVPQGRPCYSGSPYEPIPVSQLEPNLAATRQALQVLEMREKFPGVSVQSQAVRHYPEPAGALASGVVGYTSRISSAQLEALPVAKRKVEGTSDVGSTGLESQYEKYLHGSEGVKQVSVDHLGAVTATIRDTKPVAGDTIVTNLDAKVQATLEKTLHSAITTARASGHTADYAAGVVLNVRTGGVVAMGSLPTYSPSHAPPTLSVKQFASLEHRKGSPQLDKSFQTAAAPGSTFKLVSSLGLIHDGTANIGGAYDCPSTFQNRHNFDGENGKGYISFHEALVVSCDTFFFKLGYADWLRDRSLIGAHKAPLEGVQNMARSLGMGGNPGVDLPNATTGHIADRRNQLSEWKQLRSDYCTGAKNPTFTAQHRADDAYYCRYGGTFQPGDQENEDLGQGTVEVSPLQLAVAYAAIANGGTVFEPRVAKAIISPTGTLVKRIKAPVRGHLPVSAADVSYLRNAFYGVVNETAGTAHSLYAGAHFPLNKVAVGGKTGTAELPNSSQDGSWFASFAGPANGKPQYVTIIEVDKADQGAISAAPSSLKMWDAIYGVGGQRAIFPNGVPPTTLPSIPGTHAAAPGHGGSAGHRGMGGQGRGHPAHKHQGASARTTPGPGTTTTAAGLGLPPALEQRIRRGSLS